MRLGRGLLHAQLERVAAFDAVGQLRGQRRIRDHQQRRGRRASPPRGAARVIPGRTTSVGSSALSSAGSRNTRTSRMLAKRRLPHLMERGLYIAASGMLAEQVRQDQIANDLANASTPGYKADRTTPASFGELLLPTPSTGQTIGTLGTGATSPQITTDLDARSRCATRASRSTSRSTATGFFAVQTAAGHALHAQRPVQRRRRARSSTAGQPGAGPERPPGHGRRRRHGRPASSGVFNLTNPRKVGDTLFTGTPRGRAAGTVRDGALEGSGADPAARWST